MREITPYLIFNGNCREAVTFYEKCLDANLDLMTFGDAPCNAPKDQKNRVMHARLTRGSAILMASDTMPGIPLHQGNNVSVTVACESADEIERVFSALSQSGKVTMALHDAFWGARFGMLTDKFGVHWMFNYEKPKQQ